MKKVEPWLILLLSLVAAHIAIAPLTSDDGWNYIIFDNYNNTGKLILSGFDVPVNFGRLIFIYQAELLSLFDVELGRFLYCLTFGLIGIMAAFKIAARRYSRNEQRLYVGLYILFFFSTFWLAKTRPEIAYVNLTYSIYWILSDSLGDRLPLQKVLIVSVLAAFAAASHPNGAFAFVLIGAYLVETKAKFIKISDLLIASVLTVSLTWVFLFYGITSRDFSSSLAVLAADPGHDIPLYREYLRYYFLAKYNPKILALLALTGVLLIKNRTNLSSYLHNIAKERQFHTFSFKCLICGVIFLWINPTKWDTYLAITVPFIIDLLIGLSRTYTARDRAIGQTAVFALIAGGWISSLRTNEMSIVNMLFANKRLVRIESEATKLSADNRTVFVENTIYPLFRNKPNTKNFWVIPDGPDMNIPQFSNAELEQHLANRERVYVVTRQADLTKRLSISVTDSIKFNGNTFIVYSN